MAGAGKLNGLVAIVTGSSTGLGAEIAVEYSREGALVTITGRKQDKLQEVAKQCEAVSKDHKKPLIVVGDIRIEKTQNEIIDETISHFGKIDILVNNAGTAAHVPFELKSMENLDEHLDIHLRVPYHMTQLALQHLKTSKGVVINISSITGIRPLFKMSLDYSIAKGAQDSFTRYIAAELATEGVRVNSINPGFIPTEIQKRFVNYNEEAYKQVVAHGSTFSAVGKSGTPQDVAKAAVYLASYDASFVTGVVLPVDGGTIVKFVG